jgi:hypothetical protein
MRKNNGHGHLQGLEPSNNVLAPPDWGPISGTAPTEWTAPMPSRPSCPSPSPRCPPSRPPSRPVEPRRFVDDLYPAEAARTVAHNPVAQGPVAQGPVENPRPVDTPLEDASSSMLDFVMDGDYIMEQYPSEHNPY